MLLSSGYSLIIKSVEIIFKPYYFVNLLAVSCKTILVVCFLIEGNLLCCTVIKVTRLIPNKAINFSYDCNKPSAFKSIHHFVE